MTLVLQNVCVCVPMQNLLQTHSCERVHIICLKKQIIFPLLCCVSEVPAQSEMVQRQWWLHTAMNSAMHMVYLQEHLRIWFVLLKSVQLAVRSQISMHDCAATALQSNDSSTVAKTMPSNCNSIVKHVSVLSSAVHAIVLPVLPLQPRGFQLLSSALVAGACLEGIFYV